MYIQTLNSGDYSFDAINEVVVKVTAGSWFGEEFALICHGLSEHFQTTCVHDIASK